MELQSGATLQGGVYKIVKSLGQGGFGITYVAEQRVTIKEFFMKSLCDRDADTSHDSVPPIGSKEMVDKCNGDPCRHPKSRKTKKWIGAIVGLLLAVVVAVIVYNKREVPFTHDDYAALGYPSELFIPEGYTSIADSTLYNSYIRSIIIPNTITAIGYRAFPASEDLRTLIIPPSVTSIAGGIFEGCAHLSTDGIILNNTNFVLEDGILYDSAKTKIISSLSYDIAYGTTPSYSDDTIGDGAFDSCDELVSITLPQSVISIEDSAFEGCYGLTSISIPNSVTSIGYSAFSYCNDLASITIPDSLISIGDWAFDGCSNLTAIYISKDSPVYDKVKKEYGDIVIAK